MLQINYRDSKPIYEQIKDGIKKLIITGVLAKDEKLPSVRELASQLAINPNTIAKSFRELEQDGYIYTISGRGSYVADKKDVFEGRNEMLLKKFDEIVKELLFLSEDKEMLKARIDECAEGGGKK